MSHYAIVRLDGAVVSSSLRLDIREFPGNIADAPQVFFKVRAGIQDHPLWAIDRLAIVVFCYVHISKANAGTGIQVSVDGELVSDDQCSHILARSIHWHTSSYVRNVAERLIAEMTSGSGWLGRWPRQETVTPPDKVLRAMSALRERTL